MVDVPGTDWLARAARGGRADPLVVAPADAPAACAAPDGSLDAVRGAVDRLPRRRRRRTSPRSDRVLRPGGRLLVVHDYGRDDVSALRDPDAPEYRSWSRRDGPFLRDGGFKIRVVHCFWTFATLEEARDGPRRAFGERGRGRGRAAEAAAPVLERGGLPPLARRRGRPSAPEAG